METILIIATKEDIMMTHKTIFLIFSLTSLILPCPVTSIVPFHISKIVAPTRPIKSVHWRYAEIQFSSLISQLSVLAIWYFLEPFAASFVLLLIISNLVSCTFVAPLLAFPAIVSAISVGVLHQPIHHVFDAKHGRLSISIQITISNLIFVFMG